tara:strand:+ start:151 stop:324 length:174 start_codon:yes stop_codon:yes gene_type:complete
MGSNKKNKVNTEETVFTPLARGIKIEQPKVSDTLDAILSNKFKKQYFSELKHKKNKN